MIRNYFTAAIRHLQKNKGFSVMNIAGLAVGITCAALIFLWVENEYAYNHNFPKRDHLYRVMEIQTYEGKPATFIGTPGPLAQAVKAEIPGIKNTARTSLSDNFRQLFSLGDKGVNEQGKYADSSLLSLLDLPFVYGRASDAFKDLHTVLISESMSERFFGNADPRGKSLKVENGQEYTVTGVFKDLPENSSFQFQWLMPFEVYRQQNDWLKYWGANEPATFIELEPTTDVAAINDKLKRYLATKQDGLKTQCFLFPMNDWNLRAHFTDGKQDGGKIKYVHLFSLIAWIILLIACINFMNLATARSEQRAKEVGVRKVMGARKNWLIVQFIGEAMLVSFTAVALAVLLLYATIPYFNQLVHENLSLRIFSPWHIGFLIGIGIATGLVAGSYPAFYLSSFNPIRVLKGIRLKTSLSNLFVRQGLVITQFSISILLIIATAIVYQQVQYVRGRDMGYNKDNTIYLNLKGPAAAHTGAVREDLLRTGVVENAATSDFPILAIWNNTDNFSWIGKDPTSDVLITYEAVSPAYLSTMHMQLLSGRDFYTTGADSTSVIINESMAARMGKEGKIGALLKHDNDHTVTVVGIVKDVVYNDMYRYWGPLILYCNAGETASMLNIHLKAGMDLAASLDKVGRVMKNFSPAYPFDYTFLDEEIGRQFKAEVLIGKLAAVFATLAVFISCLGLFGLAAYITERRTKEIGIRKVLGATTPSLAALLSGDFLKWVLVACGIAFPLGWWIMHSWLQGYDYRTTIHWWTFGLAGIGALVIALLTVSYQALKTALANPVKSLRSE